VIDSHEKVQPFRQRIGEVFYGTPVIKQGQEKPNEKLKGAARRYSRRMVGG